MLGAVGRRFGRAWAILMRLGVIVGVLLAGLMIGRVAVRLAQPGILLAAGFLPAAGLVLLRHARLEHGILGIVLVAAAVRFSLPTGTASRVPMSLVLTAVVVVLWIGKMLVHDKRLWLKRSPTNIPLLGFSFVCIISLFWSSVFRDVLVVVWDSWPFVQLGGLMVMVLLPGAFLLTANLLEDTKWIVWLTVTFLTVGTVAIAGYYWHLPVEFLQVRPLFPTWFICLAYSLALFHRRLRWQVRLLLLLLAGAWLYRVFVQQFAWLSAWMPALAAMGLISFFRSKKLPIVLVVVCALYVALNWTTIEAMLQEESEVSGFTRLAAYEHNWRVTGKHLLFGVGPAGYAAYYMTYFPMEAMASHSTYIDVLSQTGVVGLFFFVWFFLALFGTLWRLRQRVRGRSDFVEAFAMAATGGYVGTILSAALGDWIVPFVYTQTIQGFDYAVYTWTLLGAAVSLYHILAAPEPGEAQHLDLRGM